MRAFAPTGARHGTDAVAASPATASVPLLFVALFLGLPLFWILRLGFGYPGLDIEAFRRLSESPAHLRIGWQTLSMAAFAMVAALVLGYPAAYTMARLAPPWRSIALSLVSLPLWTSLLVRTYAFIVLLAPNGPVGHLSAWLRPGAPPAELLYGRAGALIGLTHSVLPYLILPIYAALLKVDAGLVRAASSLGATPAAAFFRVVLPLTLPGVAAGCLFAFLLGLGAFVIPALLGGTGERTVAMLIESTANQSLDWNLAAVLALELLIGALLLIGLQQRLFGLGAMFGSEILYERLGARLAGFTRLCRAVTAPLQSTLVTTAVRRRRRAAAILRLDRIMAAVAGFSFAFLALPLIIVVPLSFSAGKYLQFPPPGLSLQWYVRFLGDPRWLSATGLSALIAVAVVVLALVVGTIAAVVASRGSPRLRPFLVVGCLAPMIIPNMVMAVGIFFAFSQLGLVGTATGLVLAHSLLALPFVFITVLAGLREVDPSLEQAAAVMGAPPLRAAWWVVLPLLKPFLLAAALFAFIVSFDEIVLSLFLTSVSVRTLPKMMWENITMFVDPTISAVSVILILLSSLLLLASQGLQRRSTRSPSAAKEPA